MQDALKDGKLIDTIPNWKKGYEHQLVLIVEINGYPHEVPCFEKDGVLHLITVYPSRKVGKLYNLK